LVVLGLGVVAGTLPRLGEEIGSWEGNPRAEGETADFLAAYLEVVVEEGRPELEGFRMTKIQREVVERWAGLVLRELQRGMI
jgi:hypothetical protein